MEFFLWIVGRTSSNLFLEADLGVFRLCSTHLFSHSCCWDSEGSWPRGGFVFGKIERVRRGMGEWVATTFATWIAWEGSRAKHGCHTQTMDIHWFLFRSLSLVKIPNSVFWERVKKRIEMRHSWHFHCSIILPSSIPSAHLFQVLQSVPSMEKKDIRSNCTNFTPHANTKEPRERYGGETVWIHPLLLGCAKGFFFLAYAL